MKQTEIPKVSVVMAVYNSERYIKEAVESILNQTYKNLELIIVNDASTDDTGKILEGFSDPRIKVETHKRRLGPARSRNDAIEKSSGEYIAIMDADDISAPERIEIQARFLDENKDIGLVGSGRLEIDSDGTPLYPKYFPSDDNLIKKNILKESCFCHPSIMFRKTIFQKIGGYREEFEVSEDFDMLLRFAEVSRMYNLKNILYMKRLSMNSLSIARRKKLKQYHKLACELANARKIGRRENIELKKSEIVSKDDIYSGVETFFSHFVSRIQSSFVLSKYYYGNGCVSLYNGEMRKARMLFGRCLRYNIFHLKGLIAWFICFLPCSIVNYLLSRKA
jgi:glycosyltransferase involved in cell wall biosynthesis